MSDLEENAKKKPLKIVNNSLSPSELKQDSSGMQNSFFSRNHSNFLSFQNSQARRKWSGRLYAMLWFT